MPPYHVPDEATVLGYFDTLSNWGRWGADDQLGTLNLVTPEKTRRAVALVKEGVTVSCARPITNEAAADVRSTPLHLMAYAGEGYSIHEQGHGELQAAADFIGMIFHGFTITHIDTLAHIFWKGRMYNDRPAHLITSREGATVESIELMAQGVITRGVLLDIARLRGVDWMKMGEGIMREELEAAEKAQGVTVGPGDVLFLRTGNWKRRETEGAHAGAERSGPHASCLPFFRERDIALLGSDTPNDVIPTGYPSLARPVHQVGIVGMGLWLIDNCGLEDLAAACAARNRWEFMLTLAPLRIRYGTGSPVSPIAVF